jgi:chromosomal replication initiator protein
VQRGDAVLKETNATDLWKRACRSLREILHPDVFSRWIEVITPVSLEGDVLTLSVDNDFYQTWLEDNYLPLIENALAAAHGEKLTIAFTVIPRQAPVPEDEPPRTNRRTLRERLMRRTSDRPSLNARFTFDRFVVGPSNNFAYAASQAVAQAPARAYNPLFIYGDVGLGKTHLMQAIGHHVADAMRANVCYVTCEVFVNEYIAALQSRELVEFRRKYRNTDLLLIDDIHFLGKKERMQEEFFHTFNSLFDAHKQIVMTSDRPASEIAGLEQRLVSRFEWGLVSELETPDLETRIAILQNKQRQAQVALPEDMLLFIAENIRSNVRRLEGALVRAVSYASLTGRDLTLETLQYLLRDTLEQEKAEDLTFETIQRAVAEHFDIRLADMSSKHRHRAVAVPRQIAMYLCRQMTPASLPDIANAFCKTHATILHACRVVDNRMDVDNDLRENVVAITRKLGRSRTTAHA